ncbi:MAG: zinc ribbon domain-containing protein [Oscillospiraceae bacterium]|nr:zinc ribbon domain-containing protein [Oscillospiraceae bacterium]
MFCINCGKEIAEGSVFCKFCGTRLHGEAEPVREEPVREEPITPPESVNPPESVEIAGPVTPETQSADATAPKVVGARPRGGLGGKILSLVVSLGMVIGGLSGKLVFRGTNSSGLLVVAGCLWLLYDIFTIVVYLKRSGEAAPDVAAPVGAGTADGGAAARLAIPRRSNIALLAALLMAVNVAYPLISNIISYGFDFRLLLNALPGIIFVVLALGLLKKNSGLLVIPAAASVFVQIVGVIGYTPSAYFYVWLLVDVLLLLTVILTVNGRGKSNRLLIIATVAAFAIDMACNILIARQYGYPLPPLSYLIITCYYGAYFTVAVALKPPKPQNVWDEDPFR